SRIEILNDKDPRYPRIFRAIRNNLEEVMEYCSLIEYSKSAFVESYYHLRGNPDGLAEWQLGCWALFQVYPPRHKLRHLSAIICAVERGPNRSYTHAGVRPCRASLSPTTTCRPSPSSAITTPCPSSSASSKSSGSSPRAWPTTTSPASPASPAPPSSATSACTGPAGWTPSAGTRGKVDAAPWTATACRSKTTSASTRRDRSRRPSTSSTP